jgi:hypothetical protein
MTSYQPKTTDGDQLVATLRRHGFSDAAEKIVYARIDPTPALASWLHYPGCMKLYATHCSNVPIALLELRQERELKNLKGISQ